MNFEIISHRIITDTGDARDKDIRTIPPEMLPNAPGGGTPDSSSSESGTTESSADASAI
jgi:hypothetical protein